MARQLVFTSAPQGLTPGRTGYCTVARPRDLRDRLVLALESLSVFPADWQPPPVICAFRLVDVGGTRIPVLSRIVSAGQDYTHRNNFLAHHLALDPEEVTGAPSPAEIFRRWPGWHNRWDGPPRWLDETDWVDLARLRSSIPPAIPAETWGRISGDAGRAALLVEGQQPAARSLRCPVENEGEILGLFCESSALLPPTECWRAEFTTCLQPSDSPTAFRWMVVRAGSPAETILPRTGAVLDLSRPGSLPSAPENILARRARGTLAPAPAPVVPASRAAIPLTSNIPKQERMREPMVAPLSHTTMPRAALPRRSNTWVWGALAGLLFGGVVVAMVFWPRNSAPSTPASIPSPAPVFIASKPDATASPTPTAEITPPGISPKPNAGQTAMGNEQTFSTITQKVRDGNALEALQLWKDLSTTAPDFTSAHVDFFTTTLLPGARKEWLAALNRITVELNAGQTKRADLAAQLAALHGFPRAWPVTNPAELERAENTVIAMFNVLDQLPDAPVWLVDNLAPANAGSDYQDASGPLSIPELSTLLAANAGNFHVAAAPATSLQPPPAAQWFNFTILSVDFEAGNYLVLHDASRGSAGGRFMQLLVDKDKPGQVTLTWRIFQPNSDFYQRFAANGPLRPMSRDLWLHFTGEPPLPSFYLLLRRLGGVTGPSWKPLILPESWLELQGAPARVGLPAWLANNLILHAPSGQSFHLEPAQLPLAAQTVTVTQNPADTAGRANYQVALLVNQLNDKYRGLQTELARAQQQLNELQTSASPAQAKAAQPMIDQATQTVKKLQASLDQLQAAAQAAAKPDWALTAAPWLLYYSHSTAEPMVFLQFTPHETGSTP